VYFELSAGAMAKKHFLLPSWLVNRVPVLRKGVWMVEAAFVRLLVALIRAMPLQRAYRFANAVFRGLKPVLPFTAKIRRNLSVAFPDRSAAEIERLTRAVCGNLGKAGVDLVLADRIWAEREQRIEYEVAPGVDMHSLRQRPAVMVLGHIGAWQIAILLAGQYGLHVTSLYAPEENPYLRDFLFRLRAFMPVHWIDRDGSMRRLSKELRQGNIVGLAADTRFDGGVPVSFFGATMPANPSPARLAIRYGCDLIPVRAERLEGERFRIVVCAPIRPADPAAPVEDQVRQMTAEMFGCFESWIRAMPEQWICFSRRWPQEAYRETPGLQEDPGSS
jgi:KDO2-lipid IV(A) lauroyltransferase